MGIIANVFLFGIKLTTGILINSIAFIGDAFNNLSDATTALVTIIGFKLAGKPADKEHPFGHGRLEYITGLIVSLMIILVGYELFKSSLGRIINPVAVPFNLPAFLILLVAVCIKCWLFFFNRFLSKAIVSKALLATSYDSFTDMIGMACIGISLTSSLFTKFQLDGYAGIIVSVIIFFTGISLTKETISPLLGEVPEQELINKISKMILGYEKVAGIHDLIVHTYGPRKYMATIHIELPISSDIIEMHEYVDEIERRVSAELGVFLTIHLDPLNLDSQEIIRMQNELVNILQEFPEVISYHDFRIVGKGEKENLVFDVVCRKLKDSNEKRILVEAIDSKMKEKHPCYNCIITVDQNDMLTGNL